MEFEEKLRNLNITWDDEETNKKVSDVYTSAEALIDDYAGVTVDYSSDKLAAQLLKDCARYVWNDCLDEFESRYGSQLNALRNKYLVEAAVVDNELSEQICI